MTYSETDALDASAPGSRPDTPVPFYPLAPSAENSVSSPANPVREEATPSGEDAQRAPVSAQAGGDQLASLRSLLAQHLTAEPGSAAGTEPQSLESLVNMLYNMTTTTSAVHAPPAAFGASFPTPEAVQADAPNVEETNRAKAAESIRETPSAPTGPPVTVSAEAAEAKYAEQTAKVAAEATAPAADAPTPDAPTPSPIPAIVAPAENAPRAPAEAAQENMMSIAALEHDTMEEATENHSPAHVTEHIMEHASALPASAANGTKNGAARLSMPAPAALSVISAQAEAAPAPAGIMSFTLTSGQTTAALHIAPQTNVSAIVLEQRPDEIVLKLQITP